MHVTHRLVLLLSLDHFFSCESLLIRNIPIPWAWEREGKVGREDGGEGKREAERKRKMRRNRKRREEAKEAKKEKEKRRRKK